MGIMDTPAPDAKNLIREANALLPHPLFDEQDCGIAERPLPFYRSVSLLSLTAFTTHPVLTLEFFKTPQGLQRLDGSKESFHNLHRAHPPLLDRTVVVSYARFYLSRLQGADDSFKLVETLPEIEFTSEISPSRLLSLKQALFTAEVYPHGTGFLVIAPLLYMDYLYKAEMAITPEGEVSIVREEVLLEEVPTRDIWLE